MMCICLFLNISLDLDKFSRIAQMYILKKMDLGHVISAAVLKTHISRPKKKLYSNNCLEKKYLKKKYYILEFFNRTINLIILL